MDQTPAPARTAMPVAEGERLPELDVLRGVALLGVLLSNFVGVAGAGVLATEAQLAALPTARIDAVVEFIVHWLVADKANTLFACLFGLGFYLQMRRSAGRPGFEQRYRRRLGWLLLFGVANLLFLWQWDILNLYALCGFLLLAMRRWSTRSLVVFGLTAALYSDRLQAWIAEATGRVLIPESLYGDEAVLARQAVAVAGSYRDVFAMQWSMTWEEWIAGGMLAAWIVYALGRFALGAAIGRSGLLDDIPAHLPRLRAIAAWALPAGLLAALLVRLVGDGLWEATGGNGTLEHLAHSLLRSPAALLLAAGYAAAISTALHGARGRRVWSPFAAVGRMALTNYLVQGFLYAFVLYGVGPGLGLTGRIGSAAIVAISLGVLRRPGRLQPLVAGTVPLRPDGMAVARAHLWPAPALPPRRHAAGDELTVRAPPGIHRRSPAHRATARSHRPGACRGNRAAGCSTRGGAPRCRSRGLRWGSTASPPARRPSSAPFPCACCVRSARARPCRRRQGTPAP